MGKRGGKGWGRNAEGEEKGRERREQGEFGDREGRGAVRGRRVNCEEGGCILFSFFFSDPFCEEGGQFNEGQSGFLWLGQQTRDN